MTAKIVVINTAVLIRFLKFLCDDLCDDMAHNQSNSSNWKWDLGNLCKIYHADFDRCDLIYLRPNWKNWEIVPLQSIINRVISTSFKRNVVQLQEFILHAKIVKNQNYEKSFPTSRVKGLICIYRKEMSVKFEKFTSHAKIVKKRNYEKSFPTSRVKGLLCIFRMDMSVKFEKFALKLPI